MCLVTNLKHRVTLRGSLCRRVEVLLAALIAGAVQPARGGQFEQDATTSCDPLLRRVGVLQPASDACIDFVAHRTPQRLSRQQAKLLEIRPCKYPKGSTSPAQQHAVLWFSCCSLCLAPLAEISLLCMTANAAPCHASVTFQWTASPCKPE